MRFVVWASTVFDPRLWQLSAQRRLLAEYIHSQFNAVNYKKEQDSMEVCMHQISDFVSQKDPSIGF